MNMTFMQYLNEVNISVDASDPAQASADIKRASRANPNKTITDQLNKARDEFKTTNSENSGNARLDSLKKSIARKRMELAQLEQQMQKLSSSTAGV